MVWDDDAGVRLFATQNHVTSLLSLVGESNSFERAAKLLAGKVRRDLH